MVIQKTVAGAACPPSLISHYLQAIAHRPFQALSRFFAANAAKSQCHASWRSQFLPN
jgi:hypothetical protein